MTRCDGTRFKIRDTRFRLDACPTLIVLAILLVARAFSSAQTPTSKKSESLFTINTQPNAIVWVDEVRRGVTGNDGRLRLPIMKAGRHTIRVRAVGFKEVNMPLLLRRREISVKLLKTTDPAELKFQEAETAREQSKDETTRRAAAELYRDALRLRPSFAAAHVGLARVLMDLNDHQNALAEIAAARRSRPIYPEASAVEGRIYREAAFDDEAVRSFRQAIQEGRGFQPEAHVGLARILEEKGETVGAIAEFKKAIAQLSDSEPVIYQMLGAAYEKGQKYKEAVVAYEKYLQLAPNGSLAPAVRSIIEQLRREAAGEEIVP